MKIFIFRDYWGWFDELSKETPWYDCHYQDGALVIIAEDLAHAQELINAYKDSEMSKNHRRLMPAIPAKPLVDGKLPTQDDGFMLVAVHDLKSIMVQPGVVLLAYHDG